MKKKIILLLIMSLFFVVGCNSKKDDSKDNGLEKDEYSISLGKIVKVKEDLTIQLESVSDSRCPENVECYWQGELDYSLSINETSYKISTVLNPKIELEKYELNIVSNKCNENTLVFRLDNK